MLIRMERVISHSWCGKELITEVESLYHFDDFREGQSFDLGTISDLDVVPASMTFPVYQALFLF